MRNLSITVLIVTLLSAIPLSSVCAEETPLVGTWVNTNDQTRACPEFEIAIGEDGPTFVWWGKTSPKDSRYGPFPLSISSNGKSATAEQVTKFSEMKFTVKLRGDEAVLKMEIEYTDDSGRSDREVEEKFERAE